MAPPGKDWPCSVAMVQHADPLITHSSPPASLPVRARGNPEHNLVEPVQGPCPLPRDGEPSSAWPRRAHQSWRYNVRERAHDGAEEKSPKNLSRIFWAAIVCGAPKQACRNAINLSILNQIIVAVTTYSYPTLCHPMDGSPQGSPAHGNRLLSWELEVLRLTILRLRNGCQPICYFVFDLWSGQLPFIKQQISRYRLLIHPGMEGGLSPLAAFFKIF